MRVKLRYRIWYWVKNHSRFFYMLWVILLGFMFAFALTGCSDSSANTGYHIEVTYAADGATCYVFWHNGAVVGGNCK